MRLADSPMLCAALVVAGVLASPAPAQDVAPAEVKAMLDSLKVLKEKNNAATKAQHAKVVQDFLGAAANNASAIDFYEEAVRSTQFQGQNKEATQFREWRKKEADGLKNPDIQNAVRLHILYLALSIERATGKEVKDLLPALISYTRQFGTDRQALQGSDEFMKKNISESIFVRWYGIASWLSKLEDWEQSPGSVDGIFETTILPEMRRTKDPRLIEYWDGKIQREAEQASRSQLTFDTGRFEVTRKPSLLWSRAQDLLLLGQHSKAVNEMFALIKAHPGHPEVSQWIAGLEQVLSPSKGTESNS